jgi:dCTP deaminase
VQRGELVISPFDDALVQPSSYDVRLDQFFSMRRDDAGTIDPAVDQTDRYDHVEVPAEGSVFFLPPGRFCLAATFEHLQLPHWMVAQLEGKSSLGRLGLEVHSTAGYIDPGFRGHVTLELTNNEKDPIYLHPGMKIGQLVFARMAEAATFPYGSRAAGSRYQDQPRGPVPSLVHLGFRAGLPALEPV